MNHILCFNSKHSVLPQAFFKVILLQFEATNTVISISEYGLKLSCPNCFLENLNYFIWVLLVAGPKKVIWASWLDIKDRRFDLHHFRQGVKGEVKSKFKNVILSKSVRWALVHWYILVINRFEIQKHMWVYSLCLPLANVLDNIC